MVVTLFFSEKNVRFLHLFICHFSLFFDDENSDGNFQYNDEQKYHKVMMV